MASDHRPIREALRLLVGDRERSTALWLKGDVGNPAGATLQVLEHVRTLSEAVPRLTMPNTPPSVHPGGGWAWQTLPRLSTRWTLLLGFRPASVFLFPAESADYGLLWVSGHPAVSPPIHLVTAALALIADIGQNRLATRVERTESQRIEVLIRRLPMPVVFLESAPMRAFLNPAAREVLALPDQGAISAGQVTHALRARLSQAALPEAGATTPRDAESSSQVHGWYEAEQRTWEINSQHLNELGVTGRLWVFTDVSGIRKSERLSGEVQSAKTVAQLVAGVAHQFNNLLTVIMGGAEVGLNADFDRHAIRAASEATLAAAERGAELVRLLRVTDLAAPAQRRRFLLAPRLDALQPDILRRVGSRIQWQCQVPEEPVWLDVNPAVFDQVVLQLIANACEAMPRGGELRLEVTQTLATGLPDSGSGRTNRLAVYLRFCDNGPGMSAEVLRRAREPFFSTRGLAEAQGLGLWMADGFARQSHGRLTLESRPERGTIVTLILPSASASRSGSEPIGNP